MTVTRWRKSTFTNPNGNCVELAHTLDRVRDSKDPNGPALRGDLAALVASAKAGSLVGRDQV